MGPEQGVVPTDNDLITKIIDENEKMSPSLPAGGSPGKARAQHRKHHGCVTAKFTVADNIPRHLQKGVFKTPGLSLDALIRFSNGSKPDDTERDAHGMAIKLLGIKGPRVSDGDNWQTVQDFVLIDHETFFSGSLAEYEQVNQAVAASMSDDPAKKVGFQKILDELKTAGRIGLHAGIGVLWRAFNFAHQKPPASPLSTHYWSTTPYKLGDADVKYMARSAQLRTPAEMPQSPDFLQAALLAELGTSSARFDFCVHVRINPEAQPIEDPTVPWSSNGNPAIRLATITIPPQQDLRMDMAERLVFSPWNCLAAHEPLGKINLARKSVYTALSGARHSGLTDQQKWANGG